MNSPGPLKPTLGTLMMHEYLQSKKELIGIQLKARTSYVYKAQINIDFSFLNILTDN